MTKLAPSIKWLVATDLDGTLLDHHTYRWQSAEPAIQRLKELNIPIVLNTSKTLQEVQQLVTEMSLADHPVIVENGSALFLKGKTIEFGIKRAELIDWMKHTRKSQSVNFESYSDWSVDQIMLATGLSFPKAQASANKHYSEPFIWKDSLERLAHFSTLANQSGYEIVKGGRFYHLQGRVSKATPLDWMRENVSELWPGYDQLKVIALGDNQNDIAMLNSADYPICIRSPVTVFPDLIPRTEQQPPIGYSIEFGPSGWNEQINRLLNELKLENKEETHG